MKRIRVESQAPPERVEGLGVRQWPTWSKEVSEFPWTYDQEETCYFLEGEVEVVPEQGEPVVLRAGDLATFPAGLSCTWKVRRPVRKHYRLG